METVNASLNYLEDRQQRPVSYTYRPPEGVEPRTGRYAKFNVSIHDARGMLSQLSLDREGVVLTHQESKVTNFYDSDEVRAVYYPEVERMVKELTGAIKVHVFDRGNMPLAKIVADRMFSTPDASTLATWLEGQGFTTHDGSGAMLHGARWNSPGRRVIYASENYAGALLEILAHASGGVPRWKSSPASTSRPNAFRTSVLFRGAATAASSS